MRKKNGLADPTRLKPFDPEDKRFFQVVIETPKGSRNKFAFDPVHLGLRPAKVHENRAEPRDNENRRER
jgi:hypothetical protein